MTHESLPPRPFSPFVRLLIGAGTTALLGEWARYQADLTWAALPLGAGGVVTLVSVARGVRDRRRWRQAVAALEAEAAGERDPNDGLPLPSGPTPSPHAAEPDTVVALRRDPGITRPATIARDADAADAPRSDAPRETVTTARDRSEGDS